MAQVTPYLKEHVGDAMSKALQALTKTQPADPVEFVGKYLKEYVALEKDKVELADEEARIAKKREEHAQKKKQAEEERAKIKAGEEALESNLEQIRGSLENPQSWSDESWTQIMSLSKQILKANNACFGTLEEGAEEGEGPRMYFTHALGDSAALNSELKEGQGVTWKCLEERPKPEDFEGDDWKNFQTFHLPDVTKSDAEAVPHFFKWAQIGSFVAIPVVHDSYFTAEAVEASREFDLKPKEEELEEGASVHTVKKVLPSVQRKKVLAFDTLGSTNKFDEAAIKKVEALVDCAVKGAALAEFNMVCKQTEIEGDVEARKADQEAFEELRKSGAEESSLLLQTRLDDYKSANDGAELGEEAQEELKGDVSLESALKLFAQSAEGLQKDLETKVSVSDSILNLLLASALLVRFPSQGLLSPLGKPNLQKINSVLTTIFQTVKEKGDAKSIKGPRLKLEKYHKLEYVKTLVPEEIPETSAFLPALLEWLKVAVNVRTKDVEKRKSLAMAPAEVEEGAEPVALSEVNLAEIDDDFVE